MSVSRPRMARSGPVAEGRDPELPPSIVEKRPFNRSLEGLRGMAALLVVLRHTLALAGFSLGVDIFFVLSGFLITRLLVDELAHRGNISLRRFYVRRAFRLAPALLVFLAAVLIWAQVVAPASGFGIVHDTVLNSLLYVENWHIVTGGQMSSLEFPMNPAAHAWTLSVEEQFYLVWPLLLIAIWRWKGKRGALTLAACGVGFAMLERFGLAWFSTTVDRVYYASDTRADQLLIGCCIALLAECGLLPRISRAVTLSALVALVAIGLQPLALIYQMSITTILAGVVIGGLCQQELWPLTSWPARWLGQRSYAIYLWHPFVAAILFYQFQLGDGMGKLLCVLIISLAVADLTYRTIERPLREIGRRLTADGVASFPTHASDPPCAQTQPGERAGTTEIHPPSAAA